MSAARCICGHPKVDHWDRSGWHCQDGTWDVANGSILTPNCPCEGYQRPPRPGQRLVFGVDRIPPRDAWVDPE